MSFISISFNPNMLKCPKNDQTHVKHLAAFKHVKHPLNARAMPMASFLLTLNTFRTLF